MSGKKKAAAKPPVHFETTAPRKVKCGRCKQDVYTSMLHGERIWISVERLTLEGELDALLCGLRTYELPVLGRAVPFRRSADHIAFGKPKYGYIHATHSCEKRWPTVLIETEPIFKQELPEDGSPPF
jgi:hypothetical protein